MQKSSLIAEIIKGRLYWISDKEPPKNIAKSFYFNIDNDLIYDSFNEDFGPLNIGKTWKYVTQLQKLLNHQEYKKNQIYHYTSTNPEKAANAAYLICAFQVISLGYSSKKACQPFRNIPLKPFRDAGYAECTYKCTLLDCIRGLEYAIKLGWFNYKAFNNPEYEHYQKIQNGDLNWIIPNKFVAFSSPSQTPVDKYGVQLHSIKNRTFTPNDYVPIFKKLGVKTVVRLNNKTYDSNHFTKNGIKHVELYFADGSVPSKQIVQKFLEIAEENNGALAVHCKAGLGRTGTLIGLYAMKHFRFPAADFIGWIRIARPGSILGPQQNYLIQMEKLMKEQGQNSKIWKELKQTIDQKQVQIRMQNISLNQMSQREKQIMKNGQLGQGENLMSAKMKKQSISKNHSLSFREKSNSNSKGSSSGKYSPSVKMHQHQYKK